MTDNSSIVNTDDASVITLVQGGYSVFNDGVCVRVGVSATSYFSGLEEGHCDGIGVYTKNLMSSLSSIPEVDVTGYYWAKNKREMRLECFFHSCPTRLGFSYLHSGFLSHVFGAPDLNQRQIKCNSDVFHCTDYKIPKLSDVPVVATLHDAVPVQNPEWVTQGFRPLKNRILKNSINWIDHVVTISNYVVDDVVKYWGVNPENITVIYNGVDDYWYDIQSSELISAVLGKYQINRPYVLFVGTFQPRKNVNRLVDAYLSLPDSCKHNHLLVMAGSNGWGCEGLHEKIDKLVSRGQCIRVTGASNDEIRCLYQGAKVFFFPSLYEGFGLPVLEAFASKVPVITSRGTALEEIAGDAAFLVEPLSIEDMTEKLNYVLNLDAITLAHFIEKGVKRAKQFTWENAASQLCEVYKRFV